MAYTNTARAPGRQPVGAEQREPGPARVVGAVDVEQAVALRQLVAHAILGDDMAVLFDVVELDVRRQPVLLVRLDPRGGVVEVAELACEGYVLRVVELGVAEDEHAAFGHDGADTVDGLLIDRLGEVNSAALGTKGRMQRFKA